MILVRFLAYSRALLASALLLASSTGMGAAAPATPGSAPQAQLGMDAMLDQGMPQAVMPSWFAHGRPLDDARSAVSVLQDAELQGLNPADYRAAQLSAALDQIAQGHATPQMIERTDAELTAALERYLSDLNHGRLSPDMLKHRFKAPDTDRFDARRYIVEAREAGRLAEALKQAQPQVPMYEALRRAMNAYRAMGDHPAWHAPLPPLPGRSLKPGQPYDGLGVMAARLVALQDLSPGTPVPPRYEGEIVEAVRRFQARHGLEPDGVFGVASLAALNVTPAQRVHQMALTLERLRWTPLLYGRRMIVVNIPEFVLRAYEVHDRKVRLDLEMRVVVGRALDTRTPIFLEEMRFIEFSPYWNVPRSIARGETLPRLRRDPEYFSRQGFEFVRGDGTVVTSFSGEALDAVERGEWRIRQRPGPLNSLGDIKFIFPNDQNIYLHHTPSTQLFSRVRRDFSHGCIRIEHPVDLATFVLRNQPEWTRERVEQAMSGGKSRTLRLAEPVPVLIAYSTVVVKDGGKVYFFPDIYQQDARLAQALRDVRPLRQ